MVNRALNEEIDASISIKRTRKYGREEKPSKLKEITMRCKKYFFPNEEFEHTEDSADGFAVVRKLDSGFMRDLKLFFKKKKVEEIEDIDLDVVEETISKNRY
jgi:hypothetical protein